MAARSATVKDVSYERIKRTIIENLLEPGTPLSEESLASKYGLSRTPIREILQRLSRDGLVEIVPNKGAFVSRLDPGDIHELFEMREALEGLAARLAAERMNRVEVARLDALYRSLKKGARTAGPEALSEAGHDLHTAIHKASGNRRLIRALDAVQLHSRRVFRFSIGIPGRMEESFREHLPILRALKRRDPDAAEAAMRAHLRSARETLAPRPSAPPSARANVSRNV